MAMVHVHRTGKWLVCCLTICCGGLALLPIVGATRDERAQVQTAAQPGQLDVRTAFGARGDGATDDTQAIQAALDELARRGGGVAFLDTGAYLVRTHLTIPANTTLAGIWRIPTTWPQDSSLANRGTTLLAVEGAGDEDGEPFITLAGRNATLDGIQIYYPNQTRSNPPVEYPWTIRKGNLADGVAVQNVMLVNPWQAIDLGTKVGGRHLIRGVYGQPLKTGIFVDQCYDIGRIMDVHFWNFWAMDNQEVKEFMHQRATAFRFQRTDGEVAQDVFAWGYAVGMEFSRSQHGAPYGQFSNITLDAIVSIGVDVQAADQQGLQFSNLSLIGRGRGLLLHPDSGPVSVVNAVIRATKQPVRIEGGQLQLANSRIFPEYDSKESAPYDGPRTMIKIVKGRAIINGNLFQDEQGTAVEVDDGVDRVIIVGNELAGNKLVIGKAFRAVVANNSHD
jgi:hypothetical protein